jgi:hypothetical protein
MRILSVQTADLQDLDPECLEPGEQPVESRLVLDRAMQDGFNRLHRGGEPVEVEQRLGRENTRHPDLVVSRWHRSPLHVGITAAKTPQSRFIACRAPLMTGEIRHPGEITQRVMTFSPAGR